MQWRSHALALPCVTQTRSLLLQRRERSSDSILQNSAGNHVRGLSTGMKLLSIVGSKFHDSLNVYNTEQNSIWNSLAYQLYCDGFKNTNVFIQR
ncbi:hypothetical protein NPIL_70591 [Nephila pilipes]|uniref:Uncharacterized protein n=1 Tax=Nephila pilipes TaxID=299642 RepID=A0A8X6QVS2_NEPPI|nr:hypothetical protein NPIL_70591 [Nephila pilipes]